MLPISKYTHTEADEPDGCHKCCSMTMVFLVATQFSKLGKPTLMAAIKETLGERLNGEPLHGEHGATTVYEWMQPASLVLFGISPQVLPKFDDLPPLYASHATWTGYWVVPEATQVGTAAADAFGGTETGARIRAFLAAKDD